MQEAFEVSLTCFLMKKRFQEFEEMGANFKKAAENHDSSDKPPDWW